MHTFAQWSWHAHAHPIHIIQPILSIDSHFNSFNVLLCSIQFDFGSVSLKSNCPQPYKCEKQYIPYDNFTQSPLRKM